MKIAVVILNWNGLNLLKYYLPKVEAYSAKADVWVIDNGSTDQSLTYLAQSHPNVKTVALDKNYGFAEGYNRGLKNITADLYCLLNSDVAVTANWLTPMRKHFTTHPNTAAAQPHILDLKKPTHFEYAGAAGGEIDALGYAFCRGRVFTTVEKQQGQYKGATPILWASGACLFIRSKVFWECEGFDPLFFAHQEEIDLCWRLHHKGYDVMAVDEVSVFHLGGATLGVSAKKTFLNFRNTLFLLYKNLPKTKLFTTLLFRLLLDGVAGVYFLAQLKPQHCWAVIRAHFEFYAMLSTKKLKRPKRIRPYSFKVYSVVYQYFIKRNKMFTDVVKN